MKNLLFIAAIIFILIITVIKLGKNTPKPTASPNLTKVSLVLDWSPNTDHTGLYVAKSRGWYKDEGLDLVILPFSSDVSPNTVLVSGKADIAISGVEDVLGMAAKNNTIVSLAPILAHNMSGFLVLSDSKITRPKELDGKIYGGYGSPFEEPVISEVIKKDGGNGNFKNIVLDVKAMQALESKRIDFVWGFKGWEVILANRDGYKVNFFPVTEYGIPDSPTLAFVTTPVKIKSDPDILKKFMRATSKGYEFARNNPKEAAQMLIDGTDKGTFPDTKLVFDSQEEVSKEYADPGKIWGEQSKNSWEPYGQFILGTGAITDENNKPVKTVDFSKVYTTEFLPNK